MQRWDSIAQALKEFPEYVPFGLDPSSTDAIVTFGGKRGIYVAGRPGMARWRAELFLSSADWTHHLEVGMDFRHGPAAKAHEEERWEYGNQEDRPAYDRKVVRSVKQFIAKLRKLVPIKDKAIHWPPNLKPYV